MKIYQSLVQPHLTNNNKIEQIFLFTFLFKAKFKAIR